MAFLLALVLDPVVVSELAVYLPAGIGRNFFWNPGELLLLLCNPSLLLAAAFGLYTIVTGDCSLLSGLVFLILSEGAGHLNLQTQRDCSLLQQQGLRRIIPLPNLGELLIAA